MLTSAWGWVESIAEGMTSAAGPTRRDCREGRREEAAEVRVEPGPDVATVEDDEAGRDDGRYVSGEARRGESVM